MLKDPSLDQMSLHTVGHGNSFGVLSWSESIFHDLRTDSEQDVKIRSVSEVEVGRRRLVDNIVFDGLNVLRCYDGRFRFLLDGFQEIELNSGETLIVYPEHSVTIDALDAKNRIVYGIFVGDGVVAYFDAIGFFDLAKGYTRSHYESISVLRQRLENMGEQGGLDRYCRSFLTDILSSQFNEMRESSNMLVFDAIRQISRNLRKGIVRLDPLCEQLGVCRSHLFRVFKEAGFSSPSVVIRQKQLQLAVRLLNHTRLSINEVAQKAGFISTPHFVTLVKRLFGQTPRQIRENCRVEGLNATNKKLLELFQNK